MRLSWMSLLTIAWAQTYPSITPMSPTRTDTTVSGSVNQAGPTYPGPLSGPTPGIVYSFTIRECLDSLYIHLCNVPTGSDMDDSFLQIINLTKQCTVMSGVGYCQAATNCPPFCCPPFCFPSISPEAGIKLYHEPNASGTNILLVAEPAPMRLAQGDQLLIIVQSDFQPDPTDVLTFQLSLQEYRYPNTGGNPAAGLPPISIAPRMRQVCYNGFLARDTFNTGINDPAIVHFWYLNGNLVPGVAGPIYQAQLTRPQTDTVVVEIRWQTSSYCSPPTSWPRDTAYVSKDTITETYVAIDNTPYYHNTYASFSSQTAPLCLTFQATQSAPTLTYNWRIHGSLYSGPGPHVECYTGSQMDTIWMRVQNGTCTWTDTVYVIVDLSTALSTSAGSTLRYGPNPTRGALYLYGIPESIEIKLWNLAGQCVYQWAGTLPTVLVLPPDLPPGLYQLTATSQSRLYFVSKVQLLP